MKKYAWLVVLGSIAAAAGCGYEQQERDEATLGTATQAAIHCAGERKYYQWKCTYLGWIQKQVGGWAVDCQGNEASWGKETSCYSHDRTLTCGGRDSCSDDYYFRCPPPPTSPCYPSPSTELK